MHRFVVFILILVSITRLSAQVHPELQALLKKADLLRDSIPAEAHRYYRQAWVIAIQQDTYSQKALLANAIGYTCYKVGKYDSARIYYHIGLSAADQEKNSEEIAASCIGLGETFLSLALRDSSRHYLNRALPIAVENKLYAEEADAYSTLGNVEVQENSYEKALRYFIQTANIYDSLLNDPVGYSKALANIANVHYSLGNTDKALEYIRQCHDLALKNNYKQGLAYASKLRGRIYRKTGKLPDALKAYAEALIAYEKMGDVPNRSEVFNSMGNIYYDMKDFTRAQTYYKQSNVYAKQNQSQALVAYNYSSLGFTYYEQKRWKQAIAYLDSSRILAARIGYPYLVMDAYQMLGKIEEEQRNFGKALAYTNKFMSLKDSLSAVENKAAIAEVDARYQNDKQAAEISLLLKDNQLQAAALRQNRIVQAAIALGALAVVAIAFLLVNRYRIIHRTRRQIELERLRHQIASDLHDDIGATLSSINIVSSLALQNPTDQTSNTQHLQRIRDHSERILENMSDIIWSINPANDSMDQVIFRMKDFCAEILDPKNITYTFHQTELLFRLDIDINARKNLFLIFKEAINNVAKYSGAATVEIVFEGSVRNWMMKIVDNGVGFNSESVTRGNGISNMQKRAEAMGVQFSLTTAPGKGTSVVIGSGATP